MKIVEIKAFDNGAHRNQSGYFETIPEGWALIPDNLETPNFPFGKFTTNEVNGVVTVANWIPVAIPDVKELEKPVTELEQLRADIDFIAIMTGVTL